MGNTMSKIRLYGDTSGYVDLTAPAVADNSALSVGDIATSSDISSLDSSKADSNNPVLTGSTVINGSATNSGPSRVIMKGNGTDAGFYHEEVFAIAGYTAAAELTRLTSTGSNGYRAYFKIIVNGHTGSIGNGINIKEYYWDGGTGAPTQISTYTQGSVPAITFNNSTNNVCIINLASSNGSNTFNGVAKVEWMIPIDFSGNTGVIS